LGHEPHAGALWPAALKNTQTALSINDNLLGFTMPSRQWIKNMSMPGISPTITHSTIPCTRERLNPLVVVNMTPTRWRMPKRNATIRPSRRIILKAERIVIQYPSMAGPGFLCV
jgi:hypothetical protein